MEQLLLFIKTNRKHPFYKKLLLLLLQIAIEKDRVRLFNNKKKRIQCIRKVQSYSIFKSIEE